MLSLKCDFVKSLAQLFTAWQVQIRYLVRIGLVTSTHTHPPAWVSKFLHDKLQSGFHRKHLNFRRFCSPYQCFLICHKIFHNFSLDYCVMKLSKDPCLNWILVEVVCFPDQNSDAIPFNQLQLDPWNPSSIYSCFISHFKNMNSTVCAVWAAQGSIIEHFWNDGNYAKVSYFWVWFFLTL